MSYLPLGKQELKRFDRQIALPQVDLDGQEALAGSHVVIVGMGGLGNAAAQALATMGVGELTLVDGDTIDLSNLARQFLFNDTDVGKPKAKVAANVIKQRCGHVTVNAVCEFYEGGAFAKQKKSPITLVLDCTDNATTRLQINKACQEQQFLCISGAAIRFEGALFISAPQQDSPCYACLSEVWPSPDETCVERGILSPVVSIVGYYQALLAAQVILGLPQLAPGNLLFFDSLKHQWQQLKVPKAPQCSHCKQNKNNEKNTD